MQPNRMASAPDMPMVGLRPQRSAVMAPMAAPIGAPIDISMEYWNEVAMVRPCLTKKVGSQVMKPYSRVLITTRQTQPTSMRLSRGAVHKLPRLREARAGAGGAGGGKVAPAAHSASMVCISASASAPRPTDSSQRGDSGRDFRKYHTTMAPIPPSTNMARQEKFGMIQVPSKAATGRPETTNTAMKPCHLPRTRAGTNSVRVE